MKHPRNVVASRALPHLVLLCVCSVPLAANAQDARSAYDDTVREALIEVNLAHWQEARALFERAHQLKPSARTLRGLGATSFELRHYTQAIGELGAALADTRMPLTPQQREEALALVERARRFTGTVVVETTPPDAILALDDEPVQGHVLLLDIGDFRLRARATGYQDTEVKLSIEGGTQRTLKLALVSLSAAPMGQTLDAAPHGSSAMVASNQPHAEHKSVFTRWWFWAAAGAVATVGVGIAVAASATPDPKPYAPGDIGGVVQVLRSGP